MTDQLAEIIAAHKHYRNLGDSYQTERCTGCDWALNPGFLAPLVASVRLHAAHVAELIRAKYDLTEPGFLEWVDEYVGTAYDDAVNAWDRRRPREGYQR